MIINSFLEAGYQPKIVDKIEDIETVMLMVNINMGISIMPTYISLPPSNDRRIVAIPYEPDVRVSYAAICIGLIRTGPSKTPDGNLCWQETSAIYILD